jgi:hypothetical protein
LTGAIRGGFEQALRGINAQRTLEKAFPLDESDAGSFAGPN